MRLAGVIVVLALFGAVLLLPVEIRSQGFSPAGCWADLLDGGAALYPSDKPSLEKMKENLGISSADIPGNDQRRYRDGSPAQRTASANITGVKIRTGSDVEVEFALEQGPAFPSEFRIIFDVSSGTRAEAVPCWWCAALVPFILPAYAQEAPTVFSGEEMRPDAGVFVRFDSATRITTGGWYRGDRSLPVRAELSGARVRVIIPTAVAATLGLVRPGIRVAFGLVQRPPDGVFDRVPDRGALQLGVPGIEALDPKMVVAKFNLTADGKDVLYYLDTNGNSLIDATARDRNGDGRISFAAGEGPFQVISAQGRPIEFTGVEQVTRDRLQGYITRSAQYLHVVTVEDANANGQIDHDEFTGYLIPRP